MGYTAPILPCVLPDNHLQVVKGLGAFFYLLYVISKILPQYVGISNRFVKILKKAVCKRISDFDLQPMHHKI